MGGVPHTRSAVTCLAAEAAACATGPCKLCAALSTPTTHQSPEPRSCNQSDSSAPVDGRTCDQQHQHEHVHVHDQVAQQHQLCTSRNVDLIRHVPDSAHSHQSHVDEGQAARRHVNAAQDAACVDVVPKLLLQGWRQLQEGTKGLVVGSNITARDCPLLLLLLLLSGRAAATLLHHTAEPQYSVENHTADCCKETSTTVWMIREHASAKWASIRSSTVSELLQSVVLKQPR